MSVPQKIYERVYAAERTANEAPMLVQTKRLNVLKLDTTQGITNLPQLVSNLQEMNALRDNYGWRICGLDEEIQQLDTGLADLDEVIMTQYQLVAAIANVPVTKLLGTVPKGFNATGEYDESNYHEELESIQTHELQPLIDRHLLMVSRSCPSFKSKNLIATWNKLDTPTAKEAAEIEQLKANTAQMLSATGAIDGLDIRTRLMTDPESYYFGMEEREIEESEALESEESDESGEQEDKKPEDKAE